MSVLLRKQYSTIKKEKLSEQAKSVLKSMYDTTDGFKDAKATRKIKPKFEAFYNKLKESKPEAIVGGKAKSKAAPKKSADDFKAARARRKPQTGVPKDKKAVDKDATRPAISKRGKRTSKAGNTYYEYRDNRFDKNPSNYPMLAEGGEISYSEDIAETKRLITAFVKKYGHVFPMNEKNFMNNLQPQDYLGHGASSYNYYTVTSNIGDKLEIGETKPRIAALWLKSDINPNGISSKDDVARAYTIHLEIKGRKRLSQRSYDDDGLFFKIYDYGRSVAEVLEKVEDKMYQLETKIRKYDLRVFEVLEHGGYMAKGGEVKVGDTLTANTGVKVKVVEFDPKFGGRVRVERLDEYATGKPSVFMPLSKFNLQNKMAEGGMMEHGLRIGDKVTTDMFWDNQIVVENQKTNKRAQIDLETGKRKDEMADGGMMAHGGETHRLDGIFEDGGEIAEGNLEMAMSNVKAIEHHAMELKSLLDENTSIEAWVVAKLERAETDLSDVTHYIDGLSSEEVESDTYFAEGGEMPFVWKRKYGFSLGQKVICNGEVDEVVGFVTSDDEENYNMGYRLILKENGTQSLGSVEKYEDGGMMADGGKINYLKKWKVKGINMQGRMFQKEITLGRMSDKNDVMYALKRMPDTNIREVTLIEEIKEDGGMMAKGGSMQDVEKYVADKYFYGDTDGFSISKDNKGKYYFRIIDLDTENIEAFEAEYGDYDEKVYEIETDINSKYAKGGRLSRKQKQLDLNKNGKLDSQDFKMLRAGRKNARKK